MAKLSNGNFPGPSAAARMLRERRELNEPPDLREQGGFTSDEEEILRQNITAHMATEDMDILGLVQMVQFVNSDSDEDPDARKEFLRQCRVFWKGLFEALPQRTTTMVKRYVRSRYHNFPKGGGQWTEEEDELLKELYAKHPQKWTAIAQLMGTRSAGNVRDRWRDYLQNDGKQNTKRWTDEEESELTQAVTDAMDKIKQERIAANEPIAGVDLMQYVHWPSISKAMGGTRTRVQCTVKWKQMQGREEQQRPMQGDDDDSDIDSVFGPVTPKAKRTPKKLKTPSRSSAIKRRTRKISRDKMMKGDKYDVMESLTAAVVEAGIEYEEDIPWELVTTERSGNLWSSADHNAVLQELKETVGPHKTLREYLLAINDYFDIDVNGCYGLSEEYKAAKEAKEGKVNRMSSTKKVRKEVVSPANNRKRKRESTRSQHGSKKFKSAERITDSDDDDEIEDDAADNNVAEDAAVNNATNDNASSSSSSSSDDDDDIDSDSS
ncbi:hypothetical protein BDV96DRAFT_652899 [Lophiotrema nucula]|uniref:Uncharacterized protein n=1 Tax=Lophiotrema nucula TaxID=690887 RepID=A0A6A5YMN2_9PLEO|nr:hypothetical protein BDV96DRAFT_652899 [Lophiotrema nucula]